MHHRRHEFVARTNSCGESQPGGTGVPVRLEAFLYERQMREAILCCQTRTPAERRRNAHHRSAGLTDQKRNASCTPVPVLRVGTNGATWSCATRARRSATTMSCRRWLRAANHVPIAALASADGAA
jgi:hypothetical protein